MFVGDEKASTRQRARARGSGQPNSSGYGHVRFTSYHAWLRALRPYLSPSCLIVMARYKTLIYASAQLCLAPFGPFPV